MILAFAEKTDSNDFSPMVVLFMCVGLIALVAGLALLPIGLARSRRVRGADLVLNATLFWAMLAIGTLGYAANTQLRWLHERELRFQSGYYNRDQESQDMPEQPWILWGCLGVGYAGLVVWPLMGKPGAEKPRTA